MHDNEQNASERSDTERNDMERPHSDGMTQNDTERYEKLKTRLIAMNDLSALEDAFQLCVATDDHEVNKTVRAKANGFIRSGGGSRALELYNKTLLFDARSGGEAGKGDFDCFLRYLEHKRDLDKRFYYPRRKTLLPIVKAFQEIHDGKLDLLTVSQPKRTGKTTIGLNFVLFRGGNAPTGSSICSGAGNDLVKSFYNGCLDVLQKPEEYAFYEVFPTKLAATNADEKTIHLEKKKRFATITCRSIDGALTGSTESTPDGVMYIDDLVSDELEANSRARLDTLWDKVRGDLLGRRLEGCPIVAQGTRYSLYDPLGRLQEIAPTMGWRTKVVEIPALDPVTDESNFSIVINGNPMFTTEYYRHERELVTAVQWASQFQQEPFEAKGLLFPEASLNRYFELPVDRDPDAVIAICDTAECGTDSVAMGILKIYGEDVFVDDVVFDNSAPEVTKPQCAKKIVEHKVNTGVFESNAAGEYFARDVEQMVKSLGWKCSVRLKRTISNKQTRIEYASDGILKHFYFKDKSKYERSSQYGMFMRELTTYTRSGKVPHDDAPDMLSLAENELRGLLNGAKAEALRSPFRR